jgi:AmmeMemoRadiSam system protein B
MMRQHALDDLVMTRRTVLAAMIYGALSPPPASAEEPTPFQPTTRDTQTILAAIASERPPTVGTPTRALTVPHHLLAAPLIARGLWRAAGGSVKRVILIGPDHFHRATSPVSTTTRRFSTALGPIDCDRPSIQHLLAASDLVGVSDLFTREHSIGALAPFIVRMFPRARLVPIVMALGATQIACERIARRLADLLDQETLVIQSTDFSHYRPLHEAIQRDQETLNSIATGIPARIFELGQPANLDSLASQYVQMRLQQAVGREPRVITTGSSTDFGGPTGSTTSYIVQEFRAASEVEVPSGRQTTTCYFCGDVLLGRGFSRALANPEARQTLIDGVLAVTKGRPLIINLEGVILDDSLLGADPRSHIMLKEQALPVLTALNVQAATLANNHSADFGAQGLNETAGHLAAAGIQPIRHGRLIKMGPLQVLALNTIAGNRPARPKVLGAGDLDVLTRVSDPAPIFAFVHWGVEYTEVMTDAEWSIADNLRQLGVATVVGCHTHRASPTLDCSAGGALGALFSLGNFLFDQLPERASGKLLEVTFFDRGEYFARLVTIPDFYQVALAALQRAVLQQPSRTKRLISGDAN